MQTSQFSEELRRRRTLSRPQIRAEFWKYFVLAILSWGVAGVIIDHLITHVHSAFIDIPACLLTSLVAAFLSVISWIKFRNLGAVDKQAS
ncbi:hypothetical protein FTO74_02870 [Granulicella sp. WH15]|uniref:hypothetical protein n=1 Tax=Granulicella sp. WH15 TaxID=2602070 RepID=UPI0013670D63|nr:hypothetical protein [Granulicella sp. WH15]QHN02432.1 hypothetical protein FTO74_02870 [Granulicella sp. WH15]